MSVKGVFGTFGVTDVNLKNASELNELIAKIQKAGNEILWNFKGYDGLKMEDDFYLDVDTKAGVFDED